MSESTSGASGQDSSAIERYRDLLEEREREMPSFKAIQRNGPGLTPSQATRGDNGDVIEKTRNVTEERFRDQQ